jgi:hypothetical protein
MLWVSAAALLLAGCSTLPPDEKKTPGKAAKPAPAPVKVERYVSRVPTIEPQLQPVAQKVAAFGWKDALSAADVPDQPVSGQIAGREFICRYATVTGDQEERLPTLWLRFSDQPRSPDGAFVLGDTNVNLEWHVPIPEKGVCQWAKKLSDTPQPGAAAWYSLQPASGTSVMGSSYKWAAWVKIEEERGPTQAGGVGSLKGRLALEFDDGAQKSWIAGTFLADGCRATP